MNLLRHSDPGYEAKLARMSEGSSLFDPVIEARAREVIEEVVRDRDEALVRLTERFDGALLTVDGLAVTKAEIYGAMAQVSAATGEAIQLARWNIERFSRRSLRKGWEGRNGQGGRVGEKYDAFGRVGIYIPGGTAPLVSTALMTVTLARVAGCEEIVVCTPCNREGRVDAGLLYAARVAGATEIYRVGGAQAIAAMALGTGTIRRVQKVFGPGNAYVVAAKRLLFGHVAVDLLPGPSEVLVLADETAEAAYVAADLIAQAEHGSGHERVWLLTPSERLVKRVRGEIARQLAGCARRAYIERALAANGWLVQVQDLEEGIRWVNRLAPEHCEVMTRKAEAVAARITTAGALFLGAYSPTVLGDYVAGPSHELPTGGAGRMFAGLTVDQFQRRTSVVRYDRAALKRSVSAVQMFAEMEGLDAHGRSASIRLRGKR